MFTSNKHHAPSANDCLNCPSKISMSFEKRDKILPIGFVSKNSIGENKTHSSTVLCNNCAAIRQPRDMAIFRKTADIPKKILYFIIINSNKHKLKHS